MREFWRFFNCFFGVALILSTTPSIGYAQKLPITKSFKVTAEVKAQTFLVIDNQENIKQIFNNSGRLAPLLVVRGNITGSPAPLTKRLKLQFATIEQSTDFGHYGVVYDAAMVASDVQAKNNANRQLTRSFASLSW